MQNGKEKGMVPSQGGLLYYCLDTWIYLLISFSFSLRYGTVSMEILCLVFKIKVELKKKKNKQLCEKALFKVEL